jgi:hypothetical protein
MVGSAGQASCFGVVSELIDPSLNSRRHSTTWRKFCQPSKPSLLMPLSSERHRRPSCCCQQQAGSRRFDISESRYPEPSRTMAALGQRSWPFQPRMRGQRMRRWQPSPREFSSWCSPVVVRPTSDERQTRSAGKSSLPAARNKVEQIDLHQRQIQSLGVQIIWRGRESRRSDWVRHCCHEA